ncbi:DUF484 family protein [Ideonella alba]|uniref:DUF484 family protein n=1 Tax=Ideonella alba TaxID=2824118 RepID=A0A940Y6S5_9BURK|nr:DUF484 family protein [Ideonella alba]MBQ0929305.1 DUF484 family protein [Ideonella alba]
MSNTPERVQGITEDDIADYLANTPGFFERHAELLAAVQLASPHGGRAVSLQERQIDMLRERIKGMERRFMDMVRAGNDNASIARRMHGWTCALMRATDPDALHDAVVDGLKEQFLIPQVALRLWGVDGGGRPWTEGTDEDLHTFAASLNVPYCGLNSGFAAAQWLGGAPAQSMAMIPLRRAGAGSACFGLLVLGSPDALRYQADMGTEFLEQLGDIASAALARLFPR